MSIVQIVNFMSFW